jgi:predicted nucleic acid-binding protein
MPRFLVDTWFLIAYVHRGDVDHHRAKTLWRTLEPGRFITHDGVLVEFLTFFAEFGPMWRLKAAQAVRNLPMQGVDVVPQDRELFLKALALYEQRLDKEYSLVDCMSMVLMRERAITHVLTNDHHFTQAGFVAVNQ